MLRERVDVGFEAAVQGFPAFLQTQPACARSAWLRDHYFDIMKSVADEWPRVERVSVFVPELAPEEASSHERLEAEEIARTFPPAAAELLRQRVEAHFAKACAAMPKSLRMPLPELRKVWLPTGMRCGCKARAGGVCGHLGTGRPSAGVWRAIPLGR